MSGGTIDHNISWLSSISRLVYWSGLVFLVRFDFKRQETIAIIAIRTISFPRLGFDPPSPSEHRSTLGFDVSSNQVIGSMLTTGRALAAGSGKSMPGQRCGFLQKRTLNKIWVKDKKGVITSGIRRKTSPNLRWLGWLGQLGWHDRAGLPGTSKGPIHSCWLL